MVPVMQFRCADEPTQRPNRQSHIRVDVDGPNAAEREQARERLQRKSQQKGRQVDQAHRVNRVYWMLSMCRQPVEMLGAVMDRMKSPEETDAVLQTVPPIHRQI